MQLKSRIMDESAVNRTLVRMAHEIIEKNEGIENIVLVGIKSRGKPLADKLRQIIFSFEGVDLPISELDISLYRDDLQEIADEPKVNSSHLNVDIKGKNVVLVDDVLYTGRTVRAAIDALFDNARPQKISLAVLIDRGHREIPIRADYVGKNIPTSRNEIIKVSIPPYDGETSVDLYQL